MAEIKDGKITFTSEEQPLVDKLIKERLIREESKYQEKIKQLEEEKQLLNTNFSDLTKQKLKLENSFKAMGIENGNLKEFQKQYTTLKEQATAYKQAQENEARKKAFIEAGGNPAKFDKALRLATFTNEKGEEIETKAAFETLLKDDDFANLRGTTNPDGNAGDQAGTNPQPVKNTLSSIMKDIVFGKKEDKK